MPKLNHVAAGLLVGLLGAGVTAQAQDKRIDGKDDNWHLISQSLQTNQCYEINLGSTVKYAPGEKAPSMLRVELKGAHKEAYKFIGKGGAVINETIKITAKRPELAMRLVDPDPRDNTGKLQISVRPCPGK